MKPLDFLVIGAQKCATTALFEHLRNHPQVAMPLEKEVPFFTEPDCCEKDWHDFAKTQFGHTQDDRKWAKATPQYMSDPEVPARIKKLMPEVKLVAILRDPIDRAWSHFQMGKRRDTESREFAEAVESLLAEEAMQAGRTMPVPGHAQGYESEADFYLAWSEYGRILTEYFKYFGPDQLLVLYTEDLENNPAATLDRLLAFVGLPTGFRPTTLGEVIHRGGSSDKLIPHSVRMWLRERGLLYTLWLSLPEAQRGRLRFRYEQWNVRRTRSTLVLPEALQDELRRHYRQDIKSLLKLPITPPPWADSYLRAT